MPEITPGPTTPNGVLEPPPTAPAKVDVDCVIEKPLVPKVKVPVPENPPRVMFNVPPPVPEEILFVIDVMVPLVMVPLGVMGGKLPMSSVAVCVIFFANIVFPSNPEPAVVNRLVP